MGRLHHLDHFTDREEALRAIDQFWEPRSPWILAFSGLSGMGKSTLLNYVAERRCEATAMPYALVGIGEYVPNAETGEKETSSLQAALHQLLNQPSLRDHLPDPVWPRYRQERRRILAAMTSQKLAISQTQTVQQSEGVAQQMSADVAKALRQIEAQFDQQYIECWLECVAEGLAKAQRVLFLLDNYERFQ